MSTCIVFHKIETYSESRMNFTGFIEQYSVTSNVVITLDSFTSCCSPSISNSIISSSSLRIEFVVSACIRRCEQKQFDKKKRGEKIVYHNFGENVIQRLIQCSQTF